MSKTTGYYIYALRDLINQKSDDSGVSNRLLLSLIKAERNDFIKQERDKKRLMRSMDIQSVDCIPMEMSSLQACCGVDLPTSLMKSINTVPSFTETSVGPAIQGIYAIDGSVKIHYDTRNNILRKLDRPYLSKNGIAFTENGYLYVYNKKVWAVKMSGIFTDPEQVSILNECKKLTGNCNDTTPLSCLNFLELEFPIPDYLERDILMQAREQFLITYLKIPADTENDSRENGQ